MPAAFVNLCPVTSLFSKSTVLFVALVCPKELLESPHVPLTSNNTLHTCHGVRRACNGPYHRHYKVDRSQMNPFELHSCKEQCAAILTQCIAKAKHEPFEQQALKV